jgi:hypothetical protein
MFLMCPATNFLVDGGSVAAARWRQRNGGGQCGGGVGSMAVVAAERWQRGGAVVMGAGTTMFLICPAMNFLVDKNSVMYSLHTNIVPQYGYKGTN